MCPAALLKGNDAGQHAAILPLIASRARPTRYPIRPIFCFIMSPFENQPRRESAGPAAASGWCVSTATKFLFLQRNRAFAFH
jgi:hypothetical protein